MTCSLPSRGSACCFSSRSRDVFLLCVEVQEAEGAKAESNTAHNTLLERRGQFCRRSSWWRCLSAWCPELFESPDGTGWGK